MTPASGRWRRPGRPEPLDHRDPLDPLVPLGRGRVASTGAGPKAALLDRCASAGLPVPRGVLVAHHLAGDADRAAHLLAAWARVRRLAVRSAFSAEDGAAASLAGAFTSVLDVDSGDREALAAAVRTVVASARALPDVEVVRADVLVLAMVPAARAGVAFTERDHEDDLVDHVTGLADRLVGGEVTGGRTSLPKLRRLERPDRAGWRGRLQRLLRGVRRILGEHDWDVEWADDGATCWLLQVRPVTAPPMRDEALTLANHREILPDLPSTFMTSVVVDAAPDLFGYWRRFDPSLPARRPFVDVVAGRPVINLSLLTDTMRILGLPTRFVTDSMGGTGHLDVGLRPARLLAKAPVLVGLGLDQLRAVGNGRRTVQRLHALAADPGADLTTLAATFRQVHVELITGMFALTTAISGPLTVLDRLGVAGVLHTRQRTAGTRVWADLAPLRALVSDDDARRGALAAGRVPDDPTFATAWAHYLDVHGHRGVYESDLARPRYREAPGPLLDALLYGRDVPDPPPLPPAAVLAWPLWVQAARAVRAREELRSEAMRVFAVFRARLLALAEAAVVDGRLPTAPAIWDLTLDEVRALDAGARFDGATIGERRATRARLAELRLPDLVFRSDDPATWHRDRTAGGRGALGPPDDGAGSAGRAERWRGLGLTDGEVAGVVWSADEPGPVPPDLRGEPVVLVTRGVDAGWVGVFSQVAAVVVETGGELSHGSIVLRETGTPAVTNVAGVTSVLRTGDRVRVAARAGVVERR